MGGRIHDRELLDRLEALPAEAFEGTVWRVTRSGRDPLVGAAAGGRWSPSDSGPVLYTSLERNGALAELYFRLSLEPILPSQIEHELHQLDVGFVRVVRIDGMKELEALGVDIARFGGARYERTHEIAAAAQFLEFDGMLVPSARRECLNLVIFLNRIDAQSRLVLVETSPIDWEAYKRSR